MKKKRLLDSFAILAYLKRENNYEKVLKVLSSTSATSRVIMNEINVGECYYIIARQRGREEADYFINTILPNLPVEIIANSLKDIIEASRLKAEFPISYADCFAVATAMREKAAILTGDPEFKKVSGLVEIDWL